MGVIGSLHLHIGAAERSDVHLASRFLRPCISARRHTLPSPTTKVADPKPGPFFCPAIILRCPSYSSFSSSANSQRSVYGFPIESHNRSSYCHIVRPRTQHSRPIPSPRATKRHPSQRRYNTLRLWSKCLLYSNPTIFIAIAFSLGSMVDLLLPRHAASRTEKKTPTKSDKKDAAKTSRLLTKPSLDGLLTGGVSKRLKGANDYLQSWKDGLTVEQRDKARAVEQRKQVLALRMKDVRRHIHIGHLR